MYGYMLLNKKFYELGEIQLTNQRSYDGSVFACPLNADPNDVYRRASGSKYWKVSDNEAEVYGYRTVWLTNDDPNLAKKLIANAIKARRDIEIEKANVKYQNVLEALNISNDIDF